jgi:hypothetical protein
VTKITFSKKDSIMNKEIPEKPRTTNAKIEIKTLQKSKIVLEWNQEAEAETENMLTHPWWDKNNNINRGNELLSETGHPRRIEVAVIQISSL